MIHTLIRIIVNWARRVKHIGADSARWINRNRGDLLHILTVIMLTILLINYMHQQSQNQQRIALGNSLIRGESAIIGNQGTQLTEQKNEIAALSSHVDCLFILNENPSHSSAYIANPANCIIAASAATSKSSATPAPTSQNSNKTNSGQTGATTGTSQNNSSNSTPAPKSCKAKFLFVCL